MSFYIGMDFGNFYSQMTAIMNIDQKTLRGGYALNLCDPASPDPNGTPSAFHFSKGKIQCGYPAIKARPRTNIIRYLKRDMRKSITLDGRTFSYGEMITETIQHCVRVANHQLKAQTQTTCNQIGLSYPASFSALDREYLVSLAEKGTLEDGTHIKVIGTIQEPAAAALDYLAEHPGAKSETCVMAYDLGAGTFDVSVVEAFPNGKRYPQGGTYYYDVRWTAGLPELGGLEFDKIIYDMILEQAGAKPLNSEISALMALAETAKRDLSTMETVYPDAIIGNEPYEVELTRQEFEKRAEKRVMETVKLVKEALAAPNVPKPELILLTGGSSRMPMIRKILIREIPAYRDKIVEHRPSQAISCGAARFATVEVNNDPGNTTESKGKILGAVQQRTTLDLGFSVYSPFSNIPHIDTAIPQGTPIPFTSRIFHYYTREPNQWYLNTSVYEALKSNPNINRVDADYQNVMPQSFEFKRAVPKGTPVDLQMVIDKDNILFVRAWEPSNKARTEQVWRCSYENWKKR